jgi:excisionase family DNA binding protein
MTVPINRACQIYGLSYKTLRAAAFRGELAIVKIGRNWYVRRTEIEKFLEAHTERFDAVGTR